MQLSLGALLRMSPSWSHRVMQWGEAPGRSMDQARLCLSPHSGRHLSENWWKGVKDLWNSESSEKAGQGLTRTEDRQALMSSRRQTLLPRTELKEEPKLSLFLLEGLRLNIHIVTMGTCSNSNHCWHLLDTYYVPGTIISTLYASFLIFVTILWGKGYYHYFMMRKQAQRGAVFPLQVTES